MRLRISARCSSSRTYESYQIAAHNDPSQVAWPVCINLLELTDQPTLILFRPRGKIELMAVHSYNIYLNSDQNKRNMCIFVWKTSTAGPMWDASIKENTIGDPKHIEFRVVPGDDGFPVTSWDQVARHIFEFYGLGCR